MWCAVNLERGDWFVEKGGGDVGDMARGEVDGGLGTGVEASERGGEVSSTVGRAPRPRVPAATFIFSRFISDRKVWFSCVFCVNADRCLEKKHVRNAEEDVIDD
jgi:hypothetical protein